MSQFNGSPTVLSCEEADKEMDKSLLLRENNIDDMRRISRSLCQYSNREDSAHWPETYRLAIILGLGFIYFG